MILLQLLGLVFKLCASPSMTAEDGGLGVMHPATALMSVLLVGGMVSVIMSSATLTTHYSTHDSSALGDCPVAGTKVSCYTTITTSSVNTARYDFVASNNSVPEEVG